MTAEKRFTPWGKWSNGHQIKMDWLADSQCRDGMNDYGFETVEDCKKYLDDLFHNLSKNEQGQVQNMWVAEWDVSEDGPVWVRGFQYEVPR